MANIIASGTTLLASSEFTLAAGESTTLFITTASPEPSGTMNAKVQIKSAGGAWTTVGALKRSQPGMVLSGAGTYRVQRTASSTAFGIERI